MTYILFLFFLFFFIASPPWADAAITYSRIPSGSSVPNVVSVSSSVDSFSDYGLPPQSRVYRIVFDTDDEFTPTGKCYPVSALSISETFIFQAGMKIQGVIIDAAVGSGNPNDCSSLTTGVKYLEGDGSGTIFTIIGPPTSIPKSVIAHRPEVFLKYPKEGDYISGTTTIQYEAIDQDTTLYPPFGFGEKPIDIYYSEDGNDWIRMAEGTKNTGEYVWNASGFPDGKYWLKIRAHDEGGEMDEEISGPFGIDTTPPIFDVEADPSVSRGERVKITVNASESLAQSPEVIVRQRNYTDIPVAMQPLKGSPSTPIPSAFGGATGQAGSGTIINSYSLSEVEGIHYDIWEGDYEVRSGADGTATIKVKGKDPAGNESSFIRRGGTFSVGVEPPPRPVIISPLDNEIATSGVVSLVGKVREDTTAVWSLNGITGDLVSRGDQVSPDSEGNFKILEIQLSETFQRGINVIQVSAKDIAGNSSEPVSISVKFNRAPTLSILEPQKDEILRGTTTIRVDARDQNNDRLLFTYELGEVQGNPSTGSGTNILGSPSTGSGTNINNYSLSEVEGIHYNFKILAEGIKNKDFSWDTREFPDGEYVLRVAVDDGSEKVTVISETFKIRNFRPVITFEAGTRSISNTPDVTIRGSVAIPRGAERRIDIMALEYEVEPPADSTGSPQAGGLISDDDVRIWKSISPLDGTFDNSEEKFTLRLSGLGEGRHEILFRARDTRGLTGRAAHTLIVDFGPPRRPEVTGIRSLLHRDRIPVTVISDADDLDPSKAGAQFVIRGNAEADNKILTEIGADKFEGESGKDGNFEIAATVRTHGKNLISLSATDPAGNISKEKTTLELIYNNPPDIRFLRPKEGGGLNHKAEILFEIQDRDLDPVKEVTVFYKGSPSIPSGTIYKYSPSTVEGLPSKVFWDVSRLSEGQYEIIIETSDGVSQNRVSRKVFVDNTPPVVSFEPLTQNAFTKSFTLEMKGSAQDNFSGIEYVEYRIDRQNLQSISNFNSNNPEIDRIRDNSSVNSGDDSGQSTMGRWFKATILSGYQGRNATFRVRHPFKLPDGTYQIRFRATDVAGNVSAESGAQEIIIDTTPPRVGSYTLSSGPIILYPDGEVLKIVEGARIDFTISLEEDTESATLYFGEETVSFEQRGGLWYTGVQPLYTGVEPLYVSALDHLGNFVDKKDIGQVKILPRGIARSLDGQAISGARITIFSVNTDDQTKVFWDGPSYGMQNPVITSEDGTYSLLLPAGKYELLIERPGFTRLRTNSFVLPNAAFFGENFSMEPRHGIRGFFENLLEKFNLL